jgi:hypothetical protein
MMAKDDQNIAEAEADRRYHEQIQRSEVSLTGAAMSASFDTLISLSMPLSHASHRGRVGQAT